MQRFLVDNAGGYDPEYLTGRLIFSCHCSYVEVSHSSTGLQYLCVCVCDKILMINVSRVRKYSTSLHKGV